MSRPLTCSVVCSAGPGSFGMFLGRWCIEEALARDCLVPDSLRSAQLPVLGAKSSVLLAVGKKT